MKNSAFRILDLLERKKLLKAIYKISFFHDDPRFYQYTSQLNYSRRYSYGYSQELSSSGFSFTSPETALTKCLGEAAERLCLVFYKRSQILKAKFSELSAHALDPSLFSKNKNIKNKNLGWVKGVDLLKNKEILIPAQLVYLSYRADEDDTVLQYPFVSTGAAGGFTKESALLRGLYEIVERDAFMNAYLAKIPLPKINLPEIKDKAINSILKTCQRYSLSLYSFETTNDLGIPSFLSLLIDRTGAGPSVSMGSKAGLKSKEALIASMGESFLTRIAIRGEMIDRISNPTRERKDSGNDMIVERGIYWSHPSMIKNLNFLLNSKSKKFRDTKFKGSERSESKRAGDIIRSKGYGIYFVDITHDIFREAGYRVYKVIIPNLQPLYLREEDKQHLDYSRLEAVAKYFNKPNFTVNSIPHPSL